MVCEKTILQKAGTDILINLIYTKYLLNVYKFIDQLRSEQARTEACIHLWPGA